MRSSVSSLSYIIAGVLFVLSLRGLSTQVSARRGNLLGTLGMILATVITALGLFMGTEGDAAAATHEVPAALGILIAALLVGAAIGQGLAARVPMTAMPELVAILHSFVGAAAVLVGIGSALSNRRISSVWQKYGPVNSSGRQTICAPAFAAAAIAASALASMASATGRNCAAGPWPVGSSCGRLE